MKEIIYNDNYIKWLSNFLNEYGEFDDIYFIKENKYILSEEDLFFINNLKNIFIELNKYIVKKEIKGNNIFEYYLKYNDEIYHIYYNGEGFSCRISNNANNLNCIDYKEFRKCYRNIMDINFNKLENRVIDCLNNTDLEKINSELKRINTPTLVSGVGGSSVVSEYASKVLEHKNNIITRNVEPRDFNYMNIKPYNNVLVCSYTGKNYGVEVAFSNDLNHYLLASKESVKEDVINLTYNNDDKEKSFISLGATLMPCSILLNYYLDNNKELILDSYDDYNFNFDTYCDNYEIFSGYETSTVSKYLESTMVESGIGVPIVHDKYSYCHGRSTLSTVNNNICIYLNLNTELDKIMLEELPKYYKEVVVIDCKNSLLEEYKTLIKCMYLTKYIAESKKKDLSGVEYNQIVKKLYRFKGDM